MSARRLVDRRLRYLPPQLADKIEIFNGHWIWTGPHDGHFYGKIVFEGIRQSVPNIIFFLTFGAIPRKLDMLHECDLPPCVNPDHLYCGTQSDNNRDMRDRNRHARGIHQGSAKLTEMVVRFIREKRLEGWTQRAIAEILGVSQVIVSRVDRGRSWTHV